MALDELAQQILVRNPHGRRAQHGDGPTRRSDDLLSAGDVRLRSRRAFDGWGQGERGLVSECGRNIFGQIEMDRPHGLRHREFDGLDEGLADLAALQPKGPLGDRLEQRVVVDPHLDAAAQLFGDEIAGDGDHRRTIKPGGAHAGGEIGGAGAQRGDAKAGTTGHAPIHIGGEASRALMGRQHEIDAAFAHGFHQGQHIAAGNAETPLDACGFQGGHDQVGVIHDGCFQSRWGACSRQGHGILAPILFDETPEHPQSE